MGFLNILVCFSVLASMISSGYGFLYDLDPSLPPGYHYEEMAQIMNSREPGSYRIMTFGEALLTGQLAGNNANLAKRGLFSYLPSIPGLGTNNVVSNNITPSGTSTGDDVDDEETTIRQSETGDSRYDNYLKKAGVAASYAPLMLKVASLFVPGLNAYQTAVMAVNAASITAKAVKSYRNGDTYTQIGMNVGPDVYRAILAKRGYVDSIKEAVVPRYNTIKNWIMGSKSTDEVGGKQRANDAIVSFDQQNDDINYQKEKMITINDNARLNAMSGEEFLKRLSYISDQLPNPSFIDIQSNFQSLVDTMDFPGLSSERKREMASALSMTTRFFIAQVMQPGIADLI